jgi:superfamily II DNA or RNA helicase
MRITFLDPIYCQVEPIKDIQLIKPCLEYPSEFWKQGPFHKIKKVQNAYLCDQRDGTFLAGLYPRVVRYCQQNDIPIKSTQPLLETVKSKKASLPGIDLRPDQITLLDAVDKHKRGLLVAPPGIGKTVLAGAIISQYPKSRSVFVCHTRALFQQTFEEFKNWFGEENVGIIGDSEWNPGKVNVVMSATALSICTKEKNGKFENPHYVQFVNLLVNSDVLIVDEAHHCINRTGTYASVFERCLAPIRIGLTATPHAGKKESLICEGFLGPIIGQLSIQDGMEKGLLAKPKVKLIPVPLNSTIAECYNYQDSYKTVNGKRTLIKYGIYTAGITLNRTRNRLIVKETAERIHQGQSVLIMIIDVANEQGQILQKMGKELYDIDLDIVQGSTESDTRERIKKSLQSKRSMGVISTTIWREGVNLPSLDCVIWAAGGRSDIATLQGLGRGLRTTEDKKEFTIVDFLDPYKYLAQHTIARLCVYVENGCL